MKFEIKHRWTGNIVFTAEIECDENEEYGVKLGLAIKLAVKNRARLDGASLDDASLVGARLDGASLDDASLDGASLDGARLDGASLVRARLDGASLVRARLVGASLDDASLVRARLDGASLVRASLVRASLVRASLDGARLVRARLDDASLDDASLVGASLDRAVGNMQELRSMQIDTYPVTWTADVMQIGCQCHPIATWMAFSDSDILAMDGQKALNWWKKWKPIIQNIINEADMALIAAAPDLLEALEQLLDDMGKDDLCVCQAAKAQAAAAVAKARGEAA